VIYTYSEITPKMALKWYLFTFFLSSFFAVFFWAVSKKIPLSNHLTFSQCQGFSILNFGAFANTLFKYTSSRVRLIGIFIFGMIGSIAGKLLAPIILGSNLVTHHEYSFLFIINMMVISIIIGFLYYWEGIGVTNSKIQEEKKKQIYMEQAIIQTQLKLLHTRIEPEFLFNILNYILTLLDTMPDKAKSIQMSLIQYLRMTLAKFTKEYHSISQEMGMIRAYLDILIEPHENRLAYRIIIPETITNNSVPAMLIHSFMDKVASLIPVSDDKKEILLKGDEGPDGLRFELSGTGMDGIFNERVMHHLGNINERLENIYGNSGRLILTPGASGKRKFILKFPHKKIKHISDERNKPHAINTQEKSPDYQRD
jgi:histidine kinase